MDYEERYHELFEMLSKASAELKTLIWKEVGSGGDGSPEHTRLAGKLSGVKLAIEYMRRLDEDNKE